MNFRAIRLTGRWCQSIEALSMPAWGIYGDHHGESIFLEPMLTPYKNPLMLSPAREEQENPRKMLMPWSRTQHERFL